MNIGVFIDDTRNTWGPGKLALNTINGLTKMGINHKVNDYYDYNLCISGDKFHYNFLGYEVKNPLIGPCSMNDPESCYDAFNHYPKFLVASDWYKKNWMSYGIVNEKIDVWFGGIDVDLFKPNKDVKYDCLILFKARSYDDVMLVQSVLNKHNLTSVSLSYGQYQEEDLIKYSNMCKFCIVIDNTETQGFANMEVMSMNLPILVFDTNTWENKFFEATSVPYFHDECGLKVHQNDFNLDKIEKNLNVFLNNIDSYKPRDIILNNYTFEHSIKLLQKIFLNVWG
jgi:hypothetical protein